MSCAVHPTFSGPPSQAELTAEVIPCASGGRSTRLSRSRSSSRCSTDTASKARGPGPPSPCSNALICQSSQQRPCRRRLKVTTGTEECWAGGHSAEPDTSVTVWNCQLPVRPLHTSVQLALQFISEMSCHVFCGAEHASRRAVCDACARAGREGLGAVEPESHRQDRASLARCRVTGLCRVNVSVNITRSCMNAAACTEPERSGALRSTTLVRRVLQGSCSSLETAHRPAEVARQAARGAGAEAVLSLSKEVLLCK